jgi:hypothetical protein
MTYQTLGWVGLACASALFLSGCGRSPAPLGDALQSPDGTRYYWTTGESPGTRRLWEDPAEGDPVVLHEGLFDNAIGPRLSPGGAAWAVRSDAGWTVHQVGVSAQVARRSQGAGDALGAAWLLERLASGHPPGNAADFTRISEIARDGRWPQ